MNAPIKDEGKIKRVLLAIIEGQNWKKIAHREMIPFSVVSKWRVKYLRKFKTFTMNTKGKGLFNSDQKDLF